MELNRVAAGIRLLGTAIKNLEIQNSLVDLEKDGTRSFSLNINEPKFDIEDGTLYGQILVDFYIEIHQEDEKCVIDLSLEGAFVAESGIEADKFEQLISINGVAALIGIARGKVESITSNVFNNGKVVIPFVNVIDYYKSIS